MSAVMQELSTAIGFLERKNQVARDALDPGAVRRAADTLVKFARDEGPAVAQIIARSGGQYDQPLTQEEVGSQAWWLLIEPDGALSCAGIKRLGPLQWEPDHRTRLMQVETVYAVMPPEVLVSFARFVSSSELWTSLRRRMG